MKDKEKKALNIIFDKGVNCFWLILTCNVDDYNKYVKEFYSKTFINDFLLTKVEYDFLKVTWYELR